MSFWNSVAAAAVGLTSGCSFLARALYAAFISFLLAPGFTPRTVFASEAPVLTMNMVEERESGMMRRRSIRGWFVETAPAVGVRPVRSRVATVAE